jgi:adenylate cyclase
MPQDGAAPIDHYIFLDQDHTPIGEAQHATTYDPRVRIWYKQGANANALIITDPEVFATLDLIGFTVAVPIHTDGRVTGVAAADITLDGMSEFLAEHKISARTQSYILDMEGGVLANSGLVKTYSAENGLVALQNITSLADSLPAIAFGSRAHDSDKSYSFTYQGQEYVASCSMLPVKFGKRWQMLTVTPLGDFTSEVQHHNKQLLYFGMAAIVAEILIIYFLSSVVALPLERLALKVAKIEDLAREESQPLRSSITEIAVLSKAIDTLGATVRSFAAFMPVGLVKQLIHSEQKLELGGHSQFLTIFFSDLEAFSTLSEEVPTQELMERVSSSLEIVTRAVNDQAGTIDKFIGDGVMAFWGAPAQLDDHAWRACIAALRIRHRMDLLNEQWQQEGMKALNIRIGIHSDAVLVGNIGCSERMGYTVIGDGVNVASRLEGINKEYGTRLCISHSVFKEAGERLCVRPIDEVAVKGRRGKIAIYELLGAYDADPELVPNPAAIRLGRLTRSAYEALVGDDVELALSRYQEVLAEFPDDGVARELVRQLASTESARPLPVQAAD